MIRITYDVMSLSYLNGCLLSLNGTGAVDETCEISEGAS
jgi:hypothetical protein